MATQPASMPMAGSNSSNSQRVRPIDAAHSHAVVDKVVGGAAAYSALRMSCGMPP